MYLSQVLIENFRGLERVDWCLERGDPRPGWHVILGDNGSGKSSVLRAVALALVGPERAPALRLNLKEWVRFGHSSSSIELAVERSKGFDTGAYGTRGRLVVDVVRHPTPRVVVSPRKRRKKFPDIGARVWSASQGWFSASYGPFRRFTGGDPEASKLVEGNDAVARHLTMFGENVALTSALAWLKGEQGAVAYQRLHRRKGGAAPVAQVVDFLNQSELLPNDVKIDEVTPREVFFRDSYGSRVTTVNLSDGQRAVLSMTVELLRQLSYAYPRRALFDRRKETVALPALVLIDEVDAHLHPSWQQTIGPWFLKRFPRVQFLVTTHSPLVCQAAEEGSVFRLPALGSDEPARFLRGPELQRLTLGDAVQAYGSVAFGVTSTRSKTAREHAQELARLNVKSLEKKLGAKERKRQKELQRILPTVGLGS